MDAVGGNGRGPGAVAKPSYFGQSPENRAQAAEADATRRIAKAEKTVEESARQAAARTDQVKQDYDVKTLAEAYRGEEQVALEKDKGYQRIRDLQRSQATELARVKRDSERELAAINGHFGAAIAKAENEGDLRLESIQRHKELLLDQTRREADAEIDDTKKRTGIAVQVTHEDEQAKLEKYGAETRAQYDQLKTNTSLAHEKAKDQFEAGYQTALAENQKQLDDQNLKATRQLEALRADHAQKLGAYSSRQSDPFYRMLEIDARVTDTDEAFVLKAKIPQHEQANVSISVRGNQLVMSGHRKSNASVEVEQGHTKSSQGYQSFFESFPLNWPVDAKNLSRSSDGDTLIVTVPKKLENLAYQAPEKAQPARARLERPRFPDSDMTAPSSTSDVARGPSSRSKGSGTLG